MDADSRFIPIVDDDQGEGFKDVAGLYEKDLFKKPLESEQERARLTLQHFIAKNRRK